MLSSTTGSPEFAPGGVSDTNDEISEATSIDFGQPLINFSLSPANDVDMFSFTTTTTNQRVAIDVDHPGGSNLNSYLRLFNSNGTQIAFNDNAAAPGEGNSLEAYIVQTIANPGTYYFGVSSAGNETYDAVTGTDDVDGNTTGAFNVTLTDVGDENDSISEAIQIFNGVPEDRFVIQDNPAGGEDVDMFSFTAEAGDIIGIDIDRPSGSLDSLIRLFDVQGNELASNDDASGPSPEFSVLESFIQFNVPTTGTYYVGVSAVGNGNYNPLNGAGDSNANSSGAFTITLTERSDTDDQIIEATPASIGSANNGFIDTNDVDMFSFEATAGQTLEFDIDRPAGALDSYLRIFDVDGNELAFNDDGAGPGEGQGTASFLQHTFQSTGTFYVGVSGSPNSNYDPVTGDGDVTGSRGQYNLLINEVSTGPFDDVVRFNPANGTTVVGVSNGDDFTFSNGPTFPAGGTIFEGDFNGDDLGDLAHLGAGGNISVALSNGQGFDAPTVWGFYSNSESARFVGVGDFNGDGMDDFVARAENGRFNLRRSTGTDFNSLTGPGIAAEGWFDDQTLIADFDNDGCDDVAIRRLTGEWFIAYGNRTSVGLEVRFAGGWNETQYDWFDVRAGDFNGDGRDDIIGRTNLGGWFILQQNSPRERFFIRFGGKWSPNLNWMDVIAEDFNGDGIDDILGWEPRGVWWGNYGNADNMFQEAMGKWNPNADWLVTFGDYNGDDRFDVMGFHQSRGNWWGLLGTDDGLTTTDFFGNSGALQGSQIVSGEFVV